MIQILNEISSLIENDDASFGERYEAASTHVDDIAAQYHNSPIFLHRNYTSPFLAIAQDAIRSIGNESVDRFKCEIKVRRPSPFTIDRRHPFHQIERSHRIKLPLANTGPGIALAVEATLLPLSDTVAVTSEPIVIGNIEPGEFALHFDCLVDDPAEEVAVYAEVSWGIVRGSTRQSANFEFKVLGQNAQIDWDVLEYADPYSTEVAEGDEFVGRRSKVLALANRIRKTRMQSSYITGQKRVGKTSLSLAVKDVLAADPEGMPTELIYIEYGDYAEKDAERTITSLGEMLANSIIDRLPPEYKAPDLNFKGAIAPLTKLIQSASIAYPNTRFVFILDEFDEIHQEMYRHGPLAEALFANLRTLSAKSNVAFMLVGGENMPFIIAAQGDQLNKFVREPLDYFSRNEEWDDFVSLITQKGTSPLNWHQSALNAVSIFANGHPFYTKLLCSKIFQSAVQARDTDITDEEVSSAVMALVQSLDTNVFAHFWKDGIPRDREEAEVISLGRCRLLVAMARAKREGVKLTLENISLARYSQGLTPLQIVPHLSDFVRRDILREKDGVYEFSIPLFAEWLFANGLRKLVADTLGDEIENEIRSAEDQAYVTDPEILLITQKWPLYRGQKIGATDVRAWLDQCERFQEQRILFKILQNMKFVSEEAIREKLRVAHSMVKKHTSAFTPENRSQRRFDILITYVDGPAKSGSYFASKYAEENLISSTCVFAPGDLERTVKETEKRETADGLLIIDDIAVTGRSLGGNLTGFFEKNETFLINRSITVVVVCLFATREADDHIRKVLKGFKYKNIDLRVCEFIESANFPLKSAELWDSEDQLQRANNLCRQLGERVYKNSPFGFGNVGLNLTFYNSCPNNTLPIIHSGGKGWNPLLVRPIN